MLVYLFLYFFVCFFLKSYFLSGYIENNPVLRRNLSNHFTICHWNLNSNSANNFTKVQLLKAYLAAQKFDVVCISVTYLSSSALFDDGNLDIPGYIMVRADHMANMKGPWYQISSWMHSLLFTNRWQNM